MFKKIFIRNKGKLINKSACNVNAAVQGLRLSILILLNCYDIVMF